jgi:exodeoxyribonuclease-3
VGEEVEKRAASDRAEVNSNVRIYSWNINGVRAAAGKGFETWLEQTRPEILCLQETRVDAESVPAALRSLSGYHSYWTPLRQKGYGGVATFCRQPADAWHAGLGIPGFDDEGRVLVTDHGDVRLLNVYFPNGKQSPARLAYKLAFYAAFLDYLDASATSDRCLVFCGDVNTAHQPIDIARPEDNEKRSGFLPEERAWLDRWIEHGWVDTFRHLHPDAEGAYTWWDPRTRARGRNVGWRLDYCFIHRRALDRMKGAGIATDVVGSDHCPVWLELAD